MSLNDYPLDLFSQEDLDQFNQLIGYGVSGYGDLSFISQESKDKANRIVKKMIADGK